MMIRDYVNCQYSQLLREHIICKFYDERCDTVINCRQEQEYEIEQEERDNPYHGIFSQKNN